MNHKVGDKVRISEATRTHRCRNYDGKMDKYIGTIMTIRAVYEDYYKMIEDTDDKTNGWTWNEEMVEPKQKFEVGDKVIGNKLATDRYGMTKEGFEGVVTKTYEIGEGTFKDDNMEINGFITVNSMYFDLMDETVKPTCKFKVGDKVIGNAKANEPYVITTEGWIGIVSEVNVLDDVNRIRFQENGYVVRTEYFDLYTEPVVPEFSKKDLEIGYVVETRTCGMYVVFPSKEYGLCLVSETGFNRLGDYNDELTMYSENECFDIMKVYGYTEYVGNSLAVSNYNRKLLWERKEITCPNCGTKF